MDNFELLEGQFSELQNLAGRSTESKNKGLLLNNNF